VQPIDAGTDENAYEIDKPDFAAAGAARFNALR
jgi:hypothetical protein